LLAWIDRGKYHPSELMEQVRRSPKLIEMLREEFAPGIAQARWPVEFARWEAVLIALIGNEIGGIMNPFMRQDAADDLFGEAGRCGFSRNIVEMLCADVSRLRASLQHVAADFPLITEDQTDAD
jgi:hypothetical protein